MNVTELELIEVITKGKESYIELLDMTLSDSSKVTIPPGEVSVKVTSLMHIPGLTGAYVGSPEGIGKKTVLGAELSVGIALDAALGAELSVGITLGAALRTELSVGIILGAALGSELSVGTELIDALGAELSVGMVLGAVLGAEL